MHYQALIIEVEPPKKAEPALAILDKAGRLIRWNDQIEETELVQQINSLVPVDVQIQPASPDIRVRHVFKNGADYYILFNEGQDNLEVELETSIKGRRLLLDPQTGRQLTLSLEAPLLFKPHELRVLMVTMK